MFCQKSPVPRTEQSSQHHEPGVYGPLGLHMTSVPSRTRLVYYARIDTCTQQPQLHVARGTIADKSHHIASANRDMETLPDLDQGPDVFETSDVESCEEPAPDNEGIPPPEIESGSFEASLAATKFEENTLVGHVDLVDFLGSLTAESMGRSSYYARKWTETKAQRLARIARELKELQEEDEEESAEAQKLERLLEALVQACGLDGYFSERLKAVFLQVDKHLARPDASDYQEGARGDIETPSAINAGFSGSAAMAAPEAVLDLELRINELEQAIGIHEMPSAANLRVSLRDLDRKVNVLYNPEHEMNTMKAKVSELNAELETLAKTTRMAQLALPDTVRAQPNKGIGYPGPGAAALFEKKVDQVYLKLDEIESTKARLPAVLARLRSLHETHSDLAAAVATVGDLDETLGTLSRDLQSWNQGLGTVEMAIERQALAFAKTLRETEAALQQMEARVEALL